MNPWIARNLLYRTATLLRGEPVFRLLRRYEASQWWDQETLRAHQESLLVDLLRHATTHTRHYAAAARRAELDPRTLSPTDLERFPILEKLDLVERGRDLQVRRLPGTTSWKTTGGSTGVAVRLRKNRGATAAEQAASWRSYGWYGVRPGDRQARFWGTPLRGRSRLRYRAIDAVLNRDRFSAFAFGADELRVYFHRVASVRPAWVYGYVSMLVQFASFCVEEGLPLASAGVRAVVTTSEALTLGDRALLSEAFQAPVYDEYGCGEVGAVLYECEKGSLHLMAENLFAELHPAATAEDPNACRLVLTDLHNRATPLIRYDVGDRVVPAPPCACGRVLPCFSKVIGRAYDFVWASDGTRYHGEFFMYALEEAREAGAPIRQAQFVQKDPSHVEIRIVPARDYAAPDGQALADRVRERSGDRFQTSVATVSELQRERSGKIRLIQALPPQDITQDGSAAHADAPRGA